MTNGDKTRTSTEFTVWLVVEIVDIVVVISGRCTWPKWHCKNRLPPLTTLQSPCPGTSRTSQISLRRRPSKQTDSKGSTKSCAKPQRPLENILLLFSYFVESNLVSPSSYVAAMSDATMEFKFNLFMLFICKCWLWRRQRQIRICPAIFLFEFVLLKSHYIYFPRGILFGNLSIHLYYYYCTMKQGNFHDHKTPLSGRGNFRLWKFGQFSNFHVEKAYFFLFAATKPT